VRGEALAAFGGCGNCHTAEGGAPYAGGRSLVTNFGTFYAPNITPDPEHGIGGWTEADLARAMRHGRSPEGWSYYPAFPFTSYTMVTEEDVADLWAYLATIPADATPSREHEIPWRIRGRWKLGVWRLLELRAGAWEADPDESEDWNRGAYLVRGLGHCGECHTPRDALGGLRDRRELAGQSKPPEPAPNVTPHPDGIGGWSIEELVSFLETGQEPSGEVVGGVMGEVIDGTRALPEADRRAIAVYLQSLRPRPDRGSRTRSEPPAGEEGEWD
jgi:mono/diheme cytochrome c family protein